MSEQPTAPAAPDDPLPKRVEKIEAEQERQGGILEQIRDHLTGTGTPPAGTVTQGEAPGPSPAEMAEQMRQAVRDVQAEQAAKEPKAPPAEIVPREVMVKGKERLQGIMFGKDPRR